MRDRSRHIEIPEMTQAMIRYLASAPAPPPVPGQLVMDPLFPEIEAEGD